MRNMNVGDMAMSFQNNRNNMQLKQTMQRLSRELSTGMRENIATAVSGDFTPIASIEHSLKSIEAYTTATNEAALFLGTVQASLEQVQDTVSGMGTPLLAAGNSGTNQMIDTASSDAKIKFESVVSALNTKIGGRYLFAGRATDTAPLASADSMLADLQTAFAAETTVAGVITAIDTWFDTGGGFETTGYLGSANDMSPFRIAEGETADVPVTAADPTIRKALSGLAMAALVKNGAFVGSISDQAEMLRVAGGRMLETDTNLAAVRASVGIVEGQIEEASVRNDTEKSVLELARSDMLSVDQYQTAVELQTAQTQLETLYTLTARMSRMTLADYL